MTPSAPARSGLTPRAGVVIETDTVVFEGMTVRAGDRVRVRKRAGTFKPSDTGHPVEIEAAAGHTGLALGGVARLGFGPERIRVVHVRFDPQSWREWTAETGVGDEVQLGDFEASLHIEHLETIAP